jgi:hypothetical protein
MPDNPESQVKVTSSPAVVEDPVTAVLSEAVMDLSERITLSRSSAFSDAVALQPHPGVASELFQSVSLEVIVNEPPGLRAVVVRNANAIQVGAIPISAVLGVAETHSRTCAVVHPDCPRSSAESVVDDMVNSTAKAPIIWGFGFIGAVQVITMEPPKDASITIVSVSSPPFAASCVTSALWRATELAELSAVQLFDSVCGGDQSARLALIMIASPVVRGDVAPSSNTMLVGVARIAIVLGVALTHVICVAVVQPYWSVSDVSLLETMSNVTSCGATPDVISATALLPAAPGVVSIAVAAIAEAMPGAVSATTLLPATPDVISTILISGAAAVPTRFTSVAVIPATLPFTLAPVNVISYVRASP